MNENSNSGFDLRAVVNAVSAHEKITPSTGFNRAVATNVSQNNTVPLGANQITEGARLTFDSQD